MGDEKHGHQERRRSLKAENEELRGWKNAVIDALVINWALADGHDDDPRKALADLIACEISMYNDPAISEPADLQRQLDEAKAERALLAASALELTRERDEADAALDYYRPLEARLAESARAYLAAQATSERVWRAEVAELESRLNAAIEASSIVESGRLRYEAALREIVALQHDAMAAWLIATNALSPDREMVVADVTWDEDTYHPYGAVQGPYGGVEEHMTYKQFIDRGQG